MNDKDYLRKFSTIIMAGVMAAIVLLTAAGFLLMKNITPAPASSSTQALKQSRNVPVEPSLSPVNTTTFEEVISRGENLECNWEVPAEINADFNEGKLWTANNQGRSTINTTFNGVPMVVHSIYRENTIYSWIDTNGVKMGFKIMPEELDSANNTLTAQQRQQAEQLRREMAFSCKTWTPDTTKFTLPTNIEFRSQ